MPDESLVLLERDGEMEVLAGLLARAAQGEGGAALVEGPAGIGKSALLAATTERAVALGLYPARASAGELEQELPFGVVRQLLEPLVHGTGAPRRRALLAGPARRAAPVLDLVDEDVEPAAAVHGLYWLLANAAEERPVLLAVDDLQWADEASLRFLSYVVRRLDGLGVAIVATLRSGERPGGTLAAIVAERRLLRARPGPLGLDGVSLILERRLGATPEPAFAEACRARSDGNPLLVEELAIEVAARGTAPTAAAADQVEHLVPEQVGRAVARRLEGLGPRATSLARAIAVLGEDPSAAVVARLAGLGASQTLAEAALLAEADILQRGAALRFRHPLVRAAVLTAMGSDGRARVHREAARLLDEANAPADVVASHLLACPAGDGDAWIVGRLRAAARQAQRRGQYARGVSLLVRALAEPPAAALRGDLLIELGRAELAALNPAAEGHLREGRERETDPARRSDLALERATALYAAARHGEAVEVLLEAIDELDRAAERERWLRLEAFLATAGRYDLATEPRVRGRIHALAAGLTGATPSERLVRAVAALERPGPAADGLARAAALQEGVIGETPWPDPSEGVGTVAMYLHAGRPDRARAAADGLLERARASDSPARHALALVASGAVALDLGSLEEAETDCRAALDGGLDGSLGAATAGQLVMVLVERGRPDEAEGLLVAHGLEAELPRQMLLNPLLHARTLLRLAQRRHHEALADALELGRRHEQWGMSRPSPNWRAAAAWALAGLARREEARTHAQEALALARAWGTPTAVAIALRARALTAGPDGRIADLTDAFAVLVDTPWRLPRAHVELELGAALRRANRRGDAREHLTRAMDTATRCGAHGLAESAEEEIRASGGRPRRRVVTGPEALTTSERRVARLAADGLSNRAIAHQLFITLATVETHLSRAYRKLGVRGRVDLGRALSAGGEAPGR